MQTSKGGVRVECFQVGVEAEGEQPVVDLLAELKKVGMGVLHAGPKDLRLSARRKCADSSEREDEAGDADGAECVVELGEARFWNLSDEAKGEVELGWCCPSDTACGRSLQLREGGAEGVGQGERKKEPGHGVEGAMTPGPRNENGTECRLPSPLGARIVRLREAPLANDFG
jgi:hypothetical protein